MSNKKFGYARVSTAEQNEDRQVLEKLPAHSRDFSCELADRSSMGDTGLSLRRMV